MSAIVRQLAAHFLQVAEQRAIRWSALWRPHSSAQRSQASAQARQTMRCRADSRSIELAVAWHSSAQSFSMAISDAVADAPPCFVIQAAVYRHMRCEATQT